MGHAFTPLRIGCAFARDWGQAVSPWPSLRYPLGNLAAPHSIIRRQDAGGCGNRAPRPVRTRRLALCDPFASVRHRPGATREGPMSRTFGGAPGPCHPHADPASADRLRQGCDRTARRSDCAPHPMPIPRRCSATARRPSRWWRSLKSSCASGMVHRRPVPAAQNSPVPLPPN